MYWHLAYCAHTIFLTYTKSPASSIRVHRSCIWHLSRSPKASQSQTNYTTRATGASYSRSGLCSDRLNLFLYIPDNWLSQLLFSPSNSALRLAQAINCEKTYFWTNVQTCIRYDWAPFCVFNETLTNSYLPTTDCQPDIWINLLSCDAPMIVPLVVAVESQFYCLGRISISASPYNDFTYGPQHVCARARVCIIWIRRLIGKHSRPDR